MDIDLTSYTQVRWERNCQLAAAVLIVYEYFIQFGNEINYFWKQRWCVVKVLFLWSRYYSTAYNIGNAVVFLQSQVTEELCVPIIMEDQAENISIGKISELQYNTSQHKANPHISFWLLLPHVLDTVILQLRLYAMYDQSKKLLAFFIALMACEIIVMGTLFGLRKNGLIITNSPLPGLFICADADPPNEHWIAYAPTTVLITETIFLALALNKAWEDYRDSARGTVIPWLAKESVFFFVPIFFIHLGNQIIWMVNKVTVNELFTGFSFAVPAILVNRLLISIRTYKWKPNYLTSSIPTQGAIKFRRLADSKHHNSAFDDPALQGMIEMASFGDNMEDMIIDHP